MLNKILSTLLFLSIEAVICTCSSKQVFLKISCEISKIFKNTFFNKTPPVTASVLTLYGSENRLMQNWVCGNEEPNLVFEIISVSTSFLVNAVRQSNLFLIES